MGQMRMFGMGATLGGELLVAAAVHQRRFHYKGHLSGGGGETRHKHFGLGGGVPEPEGNNCCG